MPYPPLFRPRRLDAGAWPVEEARRTKVRAPLRLRLCHGANGRTQRAGLVMACVHLSVQFLTTAIDRSAEFIPPACGAEKLSPQAGINLAGRRVAGSMRALGRLKR